MADRLTKWEGTGHDGLPRAVLAMREGHWVHNLDEALRKLARYEDEEERNLPDCASCIGLNHCRENGDFGCAELGKWAYREEQCETS